MFKLLLDSVKYITLHILQKNTWIKPRQKRISAISKNNREHGQVLSETNLFKPLLLPTDFLTNASKEVARQLFVSLRLKARLTEGACCHGDVKARN